jgi:hypothetical protein
MKKQSIYQIRARLFRDVFLAIGVLLIATARPSFANLIVNGDFETGDFTGWTVTHAPSGSNIFVDHGPGPDTTFGAFFGATGSAFDSISQTFATTPGAFYTLSFFYQVTNLGTPIPANNGFDVLWNGVSVGGGLFPQFDVNPGFGTFTFHLQATSALTTLQFDGRNAPSFDFLDNVSVTASPCPLTQGYWKNHPDAWPVNSLMLGSQTYTKMELLNILNTQSGGDASLILADQLIAARLSIANGSDPTPVSGTLTDADSLLSMFSGKLPYHVKPSSATGQMMVSDANTLANYNNGLLTLSCSGN